ncbi:hypothetical protein CHO01_38260 [Cellulomonas hominis]|uniref:SnoaL-like domain-containing protein n=2 Tax=Cellulomonas hominis TaxID=156981 RepID=A0A511FHK1_9CELL|nr:hypothetical protein CHO01_38260 [Cellulomonas hominis]
MTSVSVMTSEIELQERLERLESESAIRTLVHEYCHGADKRDRARFAAVWTPDAVWQVAPTQEFRGVEAICAAVEWQWGAFLQMHHWTSNLVIDLDGDQARGEVDVSVTTQFLDGTWARGGGVYRDSYVRTDVGWRISRREAEHLFDLDPRPNVGAGTVAGDASLPS